MIERTQRTLAVIAFCGLGRMGAQMAGRLRAAGHELRVWNRTAAKARAWAGQGGQAFDSAAQAARGASQAHLMLADDAAVDAALFGEQGVTSALPPGALIVDHTTVSVRGARERSERLAGQGWKFLQCPVFGSPPQIGEGKGVLLVGGDQAIYDSAKATLKDILPEHFRAGDRAQDAATFKLMGNSMLMSVVEALAEFFAIARSNGIDPGRALGLLDVFNPCGTIARRGPRMASGNYQAMFSLSMALKDIRLMLEAAGQRKLLLLEAIAAKTERLIQQGNAELDLSALGMDVIPPSQAGATTAARS